MYLQNFFSSKISSTTGARGTPRSDLEKMDPRVARPLNREIRAVAPKEVHTAKRFRLDLHVSCKEGTINIDNVLYYTLLFNHSPNQTACLLSCKTGAPVIPCGPLLRGRTKHGRPGLAQGSLYHSSRASRSARRSRSV